jgi:hypothetical protein
LDNKLLKLMCEMNNAVPLILHPFHPIGKTQGNSTEQCSSRSRNLGFKRPEPEERGTFTSILAYLVQTRLDNASHQLPLLFNIHDTP